MVSGMLGRLTVIVAHTGAFVSACVCTTSQVLAGGLCAAIQALRCWHWTPCFQVQQVQESWVVADCCGCLERRMPRV